MLIMIDRKYTNLAEDIDNLPPVKFVEVAEKKSRMSQPIRIQGGNLDFPIGPKSTNLFENVEILLLVKFRRIPLSGCREEIENLKS